MRHPLIAVFERCEREAIRYCILRDAHEIQEPVGTSEVDLLVDPAHARALTAALVDAGFVRIVSWGRAPHRFFVTYDAIGDRWIKCDVVTAVAFGRPVHKLRTALAEECLANRRRIGVTYGPSVEDELITLLLHEMLDKGAFRPHRIERLQWLRGQVTRDDRMAVHLARYWPGITWNALAGRIERGEWDALLNERRQVIRGLVRAEPIRTELRGLRDRVCRTLFRVVGMAMPHAPSLALLAPDGAGKSTLAAGIEERFFGPVCSVYMGLYQNGPGPRRRHVPGFGVAALLMTQWRRYARARYGQASGQLVLFDRYTYDALLPATGRLSRLRRLRRWLLARACPSPDLVVVLDAPGEVLFARKGEHSAAALEQQRQSYLRLRGRLTRLAVVDAHRDPAQVRRAVTRLLWNQYRSGGRAMRPSPGLQR